MLRDFIEWRTPKVGDVDLIPLALAVSALVVLLFDGRNGLLLRGGRWSAEDNFHTGIWAGNPIEPADPSQLYPEFCRMGDLRKLFGITRSMGYLLMNEGKIQTVSLRRPGQKFSVRLVHLASVRAYLNGLLEKESEMKAESDE
jgi:hypothetical protein